MSLLSLGKRVVNLNYTLSKETLYQAVKKAQIDTIISSRKFIS